MTHQFDKSRLPSRHVSVGPERAPHRSYYYAMGLTQEEINQPFVGVATCWNEAAPCNIALSRQAQSVKVGVKESGATPREFTTITVTDANGSVVASTSRALSGGPETFAWDGRTTTGTLAPPGDYTISVAARDTAGTGVTVKTEILGRVMVYDPETESTSTAMELPVYSGGEDGLVGLTFDPNFAENGWIYLYYSPPGDEEINRVSRFTVEGNTISPEPSTSTSAFPSSSRKPV